MSQGSNQNPSTCSGHCERCQAADGPAHPGGLAGWRLVLAALVAFLLPIGPAVAAAIVGAVFKDRLSESARLGLVLAALIVGAAIGVIAARRIRPGQAREGQ